MTIYGNVYLQMSEIDYWTKYYQTHNIREQPSLFSKYVMTHFEQQIDSVLEIGCGDGKDAYFLGTRYNVTALDIANKPDDTETVKFHNQSMEKLSNKHDLLYSRFSLHSVSEKIENTVLQFALENCKYIAIEARSTKDMLCEGANENNESWAGTTYANAHYRRFINFEKMKQKMIDMGFLLKVSEESNKFAPYKTQNPTCIRIIACTNK